MDFLNGDLDRVFTVLYEMGKIEPLLKRDWKEIYIQSQARWPEISTAIRKLNDLESLREIRDFLADLPGDIIEALVVEVAREMAHYQERGETLH
jgi:hypothetical protein